MSYRAYDFPAQVRGDHWNFNIYIQDESGNGIDVHTNEYWMTLKSDIDNTDAQAALQIGPIAGGAGLVNLVAYPADTENIQAATYKYDIQEVTADGKVTTLLIGKIKVVKDITRTASYSGEAEVIQSSRSGISVYSNTTTANSQSEIFYKGTVSTRFNLTENSSVAFSAIITGKDTVTNQSCSFQLNGAAERDNGTSQLIGNVGKFILGKENPLFDVSIVVDDSIDSLKILVTPASSNETRWSARLDYTEVFY